jgi:hypothetical protein
MDPFIGQLGGVDDLVVERTQPLMNGGKLLRMLAWIGLTPRRGGKRP